MYPLRIAPNQHAALRHTNTLPPPTPPKKNFDHTFSIPMVANAKVMRHVRENKDECEQGLYTWVNLFHAAFPVSPISFTQTANDMEICMSPQRLNDYLSELCGQSPES